MTIAKGTRSAYPGGSLEEAMREWDDNKRTETLEAKKEALDLCFQVENYLASLTLRISVAEDLLVVENLKREWRA